MTARVREMVALYHGGATLEEVGERFGVSRQRVQQIFVGAGVPRRPKSRESWEARVWKRIEIDAVTGCWLWTAHCDKDGYAQFGVNGQTWRVHRLMWERVNGPVPAGFESDHLCRARRCVNPSHIELVTGRENRLRGEGFAAQNARKTHCIRGHKFSPENTLASQQGRACRACARIRQHQWHGWKTVRGQKLMADLTTVADPMVQ